MSRAPRTRVLLVVAVGVLLLDAALLISAGVWTDRMGLVSGGAISAIIAAVLLFSWRRHLRRLDDIDAARLDLKNEVKELGKITRDGQ
jgi:precorrin-6B methylase 1